LPEHDSYSRLEVCEPPTAGEEAEIYEYRAKDGEWEAQKVEKRRVSGRRLLIGAVVALLVIGGIVGGAVGGTMAHRNAS
jgi:hypothetical protein